MTINLPVTLNELIITVVAGLVGSGAAVAVLYFGGF